MSSSAGCSFEDQRESRIAPSILIFKSWVEDLPPGKETEKK